MNATAPLTANAALIQLDDLKKVFYTDEVETHRAVGRAFRHHERRVPVDPRALGLRQVDAAVDPGLLDTPSSSPYVLNGTPVENLDASLQRAASATKRIGFIFRRC